MAQATATPPRSEQVADKTAVRPSRINVPEAELIELRRRIMATRFPEKETVVDGPRRRICRLRSSAHTTSSRSRSSICRRSS
jgi:hypothetical protein